MFPMRLDILTTPALRSAARRPFSPSPTTSPKCSASIPSRPESSIVRTADVEGNPERHYSGNFAFGKDINSPNDTNYGYANAHAGGFRQVYGKLGSTRRGLPRRRSFEEYVQDSWKVNSPAYAGIGRPLHHPHPLASSAQYYVRLRAPAAWNPARRPCSMFLA